MKIGKDTETVSHCVICSISDTCSDSRFNFWLGLIKPFDVKRCDHCDLRWLSPRPTKEANVTLYSEENYFDGGNAVEKYSDLAAKRIPYFQSRLEKIATYFPGRKHLKVLEIGSATGEFVVETIKKGHTCIGLEFSQDARLKAKNCYGVELLEKPVETFEDSSFDVIHMNHVFEHLPFPDKTLKECFRILKPQGLLVLEVPQEFLNDLDRLKSLLRIQKTPRFNAYSLHHTYFFTPGNLSRLIEDTGFKVDYLATANAHRTPLFPFSVKNAVLRLYLGLADKLHKGGNIIEVYARKP